MKAHTIRIWEKRYNLFSPDRTGTNIRTYGNDELKKLLNIKVLLDAGFRISEAAGLSEEAMENALDKVLRQGESTGGPKAVMVSNIVSAALDFDRQRFDAEFNAGVERFGFASTVEDVLYPMLNKVGVLWQQSKIHPAQEHFVSNLARQKIFSAIDQLETTPRPASPRFILFLPEFEDHEIGLLYTYYLLMKAGIDCIYLGQRVPLQSLQSSVQSSGATHLFFFAISRKSDSQLQSYISILGKSFSSQKLYFSGPQSILSTLTLPQNVTLIQNPGHFKELFQL